MVFPQPSQPDSHDDDVYCSDPNCPYCQDLRLAEQQWRREQEEQKRSDSA
jgi:hypothetical protein